MAIPIAAIIQGLGLLGSQLRKADKAMEIDPAGVNKREEDAQDKDAVFDILELYEQVKHGKVLSDAACKFIKQQDPAEIASIVIKSNTPLDVADLRSVLAMMPKEQISGLPGIDFAGEFGNTPEETEILSRYAQAIHNYYYTYKPLSGENPEALHTGGMAQEIARIDPSLIKAGPRGKMVDAPRLTLTNAGAIGTLARKVEGLEQQVHALLGAG